MISYGNLIRETKSKALKEGELLKDREIEEHIHHLILVQFDHVFIYWIRVCVIIHEELNLVAFI